MSRPLVSMDLVVHGANHGRNPTARHAKGSARRNIITLRGQKKQQSEWALHIGISEAAFHQRYKKFMRGDLCIDRLFARAMTKSEASKLKRK